MSVIFDLKEKDNSWAQSVNEALENDWPEYVATNGLVGSQAWWQNYEKGQIPSVQDKGIVTFVGNRTDEANEEYETVEIDQDGKLVEYDYLGYWKNSEISEGAIVLVESFEISVNQKYGPMTFIFESLVKVIQT